jgi:hypothetical protein
MVAAVLALALQADVAAEAALEKFKADVKGKDAAGRSAALAELAKTPSPKVVAKINSYLVSDIPEVRVAAAAALALQTDCKKQALPCLLNAATANAKRPEVLAAVVAALGKFQDEAAAGEVNKHFAAELEVAKAAVASAGEIKSPTSFDPLIKELKSCEEALKPRPRGPDGGFGGGFGGFGRMDGQNNPREARERAREIQPLIKSLLSSWTGVNCEDAKDWEAWWKENRAKFKPNKS